MGRDGWDTRSLCEIFYIFVFFWRTSNVQKAQITFNQAKNKIQPPSPSWTSGQFQWLQCSIFKRQHWGLISGHRWCWMRLDTSPRQGDTPCRNLISHNPGDTKAGAVQGVWAVLCPSCSLPRRRLCLAGEKMGKVLEKPVVKWHTFQGVSRHPGYRATEPFQTLWDIHHFACLEKTSGFAPPQVKFLAPNAILPGVPRMSLPLGLPSLPRGAALGSPPSCPNS